MLISPGIGKSILALKAKFSKNRLDSYTVGTMSNSSHNFDLEPEASYEDMHVKSLDLTRKNLEKSSFDHVVFEQCTFTESIWFQADFRKCHFKSCNLSLIHLDGSVLQDVVFEECKLVGLQFSKCRKVSFQTFHKSILLSCNFTDLKLKATSFKGSKLREVHFSNSDLSSSDFTETDLLGTVFHQCQLTKADFRNATNYAIDLHSNNIKRAKFSSPEVINLLNRFDIEIS